MSPDAAIAEPLSTRRQLKLMRDLQRLANDRAQEEQRIRTELADGLRAAEAARDKAAAEIERAFNAGRSEANVEYEQVTAEARRRYGRRHEPSCRAVARRRLGIAQPLHHARARPRIRFR